MKHSNEYQSNCSLRDLYRKKLREKYVSNKDDSWFLYVSNTLIRPHNTHIILTITNISKTFICKRLQLFYLCFQNSKQALLKNCYDDMKVWYQYETSDDIALILCERGKKYGDSLFLNYMIQTVEHILDFYVDIWLKQTFYRVPDTHCWYSTYFSCPVMHVPV